MNIQPSSKIYISKSFIPNAGRGVFASRDIKKGEIIEICPVIIIPKSEIRALQQTLLINYNFAWSKSEDQLAICLGFGSLYNHLYDPSATYKKDFEYSIITFTALRDIKKGEEITVNYHHGMPFDDSPLWIKDIPATLIKEDK